jgi:hypothetical protein
VHAVQPLSEAEERRQLEAALKKSRVRHIVCACVCVCVCVCFIVIYHAALHFFALTTSLCTLSSLFLALRRNHTPIAQPSRAHPHRCNGSIRNCCCGSASRAVSGATRRRHTSCGCSSPRRATLRLCYPSILPLGLSTFKPWSCPGTLICTAYVRLMGHGPPSLTSLSPGRTIF